MPVNLDAFRKHHIRILFSGRLNCWPCVQRIIPVGESWVIANGGQLRTPQFQQNWNNGSN